MNIKQPRRLIALLAGIIFTSLLLSSCTKLPEPPQAVRGFLYTVVKTPIGQNDGSGPEVLLPDIKVILKDSNQQSIGPAITDLSGRFNFNQIEAGSYQLCWEADGFQNDCRVDPIIVANKFVHLGKIQVRVERKDLHGMLAGQVRLMDGTLARTYDPLINVNSFASVSLLDNGSVIGKAVVNNQGSFLVPQIPIGRFLIVRTTIDQTDFDRSLGATVLTDGAAHQMTIRLPNSTPRLLPLIALNAVGDRVVSPAPGDTLSVSATPSSRQKHPLKYRWRSAAGSGSLSTVDSPSVQWTLPAAPGEHTLQVTAFDDQGGYLQKELILYTDANNEGIVFSGQVRGVDVPLLAGVNVAVGGKSTTTDAAGHFRLRVKQQDRYILHMTHPDYTFLSQIYDSGVSGGRWILYRGQSFTGLDPRNDIELTDQNSREFCRGSTSSRMDWKMVPNRDRIQSQDGNGRVLQGNPPKDDLSALKAVRGQRDCGRGISVKIPGGSLVDAGGNPPAGPVSIKLSTIDINAPYAMPGNWSATTTAGEVRTMQSFGAGTVAISDASGTSYNLATGAVASVIIPIDPMQLAFPAAPSPTIPYLIYDETEGLWREHATATLDAAGLAYTANVRHFSAANMDLIKVDQSCVKLDATALPGTFKKVEVIVPDPGGNAPRIITRAINNTGVGDTKIHAIFNLPANEDIYVIPISVDDTGTLPDQPFGQFSVNTGGTQLPTDPNEPEFNCGPAEGCISEAPYGACRVTIVLSDLGAPPDPDDVFLAGLQYNPAAASFLATVQADLVAAGPAGTTFADAITDASQNYYDTIDPHSRRRTLDNFKSHNAYPGAGSDIHAIYANSGDLGFGRDMHCWKNACSVSDPDDCDVACFVTNYLDGGSFESDDLEDFKRTVDADTNFTSDAEAVATVAMEYSRLDDPANPSGSFGTDRITKFYVYFGDGNADGVDDSGDPAFADGALLLNANLDGNGERPVPQLCMVCHAGSLKNNALDITSPAFNPANPATADLDSVFLPFDLQAFSFVNNYLGASTWNKATQQQAFKDLNDVIATTHPPGATALASIHQKFYENWIDANPSTHSQQSDFVVPDWAGDPTKEQAYAKILSPSCRACHTAQHYSTLTFESEANFIGNTLVDFVACNIKVMPHAKATFDRFWLSLNPHQPALLDNFGNSFMPPWTDCSTAPPVVIADLTFDSAIEDIFDSNGCTSGGCHGSAPGSDNFHLTYPNLFGFSNHATSTRYIDADQIATGSPLSSYLYLKISDQQTTVTGGTGGPMPLGSTDGLTPEEQVLIEQWISEGARQN